LLTRVNGRGDETITPMHPKPSYFPPKIDCIMADDLIGHKPQASVRIGNDPNDGFPRVYLRNDEVAAEFSPDAGARLIAFGNTFQRCQPPYDSAVTTVGAFR